MLEKRADGRLCAAEDIGKPGLKYPVDLAVSPDGEDIYIVSRRCQDVVSQKSNLLPPDFQPLANCDEATDSGVLPRSYIYHLRPGKGLDILKIHGQAPLSCELGEDIERDSKGWLYVTTPFNHRVYRLNPDLDQLEQLAEVKEALLKPDSTGETTLRGPSNLAMYEDRVYFLLTQSANSCPAAEAIGVLTEEKSYQLRTSFWSGDNYSYTVSIFAPGEDTVLGLERLYLYVISSGIYMSHIVAMSSPYPSVVNMVQQGGIGSGPGLVFSPHQTVGGDDLPEGARDGLGDLKFVAEPDKYYQYDTLYASVPTGNRIVYLPKSSSIHYETYENGLYVFAGGGTAGLKDGRYKEAQFNRPTGMAFDAARNLYIADTGNHAIRKISPEGEVTTLYAESHPN